MRASDLVLMNMDLRCSVFKLLLFHTLVVWCGAKHVTVDVPKMQISYDADDMVQENIQDLIHNGVYSHRHLDVSQAQVVTPIKVTRDGDLVSHVVEHSHEHGHSRARRDLFGKDHKMDHTLHYNITVDGEELRLDLRPSVTFITPALIVERHTASGRTRDRPDPKATGCHYTGTVRGQTASSVAISACDGLAGFLRTQHGEYFIEPSNQIPTDNSKGRPHVVFKRSAVDKADAWHRAKRDLDNTSNNVPAKKATRRSSKWYSRKIRDRKEMIDRERRQYLEARRKQLEELRANPTEYRRHRLKQRLESRRKAKGTHSANNIEGQHRNFTKISKNKTNHEPKSRKRRRAKNCATKQPPYHWVKKNFKNLADSYHKNQTRQAHHRKLSRRFGLNETRRSARSISKPRHVEVLLVADKSMTDFHYHSNLETYLLTIMNMVSELYMDPSIGNYIKVVVVKIILLERTDKALRVSTNADATLSSFCSWQQELNPDDDKNPHHHDVAILVTRSDICGRNDTPCSTLGVAHVAGMCKPDRSCSVNEDNGITLAHTITHELGHNFGLYHDTAEIGCQRRIGTTLHIMTPIFESDTAQVAWSSCSKRDVTNFLDSGLGECLGDRPSQEEYLYPEVPAGAIFDAATQCHLQFSAEAQVCSDPSELCKILWCNVNGTCKTMLRPPAPGTMCGPDMWCQNQQCVPREPAPVPVDGGWGDWSDWSECSRSCGAGVAIKSRECNKPAPANNGKYCIGERSRYKICNTDPCPLGQPTFREVQCSKYDNTTYKNMMITEWKPHLDPDKPCELQCRPREGIDVEMLGIFVADGTPCRQTDAATEMCIAGVCHKIGCDWVVDSDKELDACGVCGGDGSACKTVQGIYNKDTTKRNEFSEVAVIPAGSRNVKIQEKVNPGNFISIGSTRTKKFYLTGARNQTLSEYFVAGSHAIYERDRDWEKVQIPGPINEDIKVYQRIFRGRHRNSGVTYQYTVDNKNNQLNYRYKLSEWSACSVTCGRGYAQRQLQCVDEHDHVVSPELCYHIEEPRHEVRMVRCQQKPCYFAQTNWWAGPWSKCSRQCRMPGAEPVKSRNVYCVDKLSNMAITDSACDFNLKPPTTLKCVDVPPC